MKALEFCTCVLSFTRGNNSNFMGVFTDYEIMRDAVCDPRQTEAQHRNHGIGEMSFSEHVK